jgi:hypothetical protein
MAAGNAAVGDAALRTRAVWGPTVLLFETKGADRHWGLGIWIARGSAGPFVTRLAGPPNTRGKERRA